MDIMWAAVVIVRHASVTIPVVTFQLTLKLVGLTLAHYNHQEIMETTRKLVLCPRRVGLHIGTRASGSGTPI
ncbi:hypothetical protein FPV67DRAFT_1527656 [Lyophyllum atratum]|nr:hypothetical protein FPV67DRAFT_1527656 [Lyophyllum atratum]